MKERKRRSVLQSARADGDGMRRPPGHLITGTKADLGPRLNSAIVE